MPTYQYACTSDQCGLRFERVQAFTDSAISECPDCNDRVRKVYGSVGVVFKGSGFYRNDSRDAMARANGTSDRNGKSDGAGTDGKKAEAGKGTEAATSDAGSPTTSADSAGSGKSSPKSKTESSKPAATVAS
jgi:putative FmdB family regulatory protein